MLRNRGNDICSPCRSPDYAEEFRYLARILYCRDSVFLFLNTKGLFSACSPLVAESSGRVLLQQVLRMMRPEEHKHGIPAKRINR
jgi:hypothetical protein